MPACHVSYNEIVAASAAVLGGVPGGPIVSRVTIEVEGVGSKLTRDSFLQIDRPKARERELVKFDANRRA